MSEHNHVPVISAVIPCRNEVNHIKSCVLSILEQDVPAGDLEILVVDGRSDDGTRTVLEELQNQYPLVRMIDNPAQITPAAFNRGILESRGRYVAIMGAHNTYARNYLSEAIKVHQEVEADNVGGAMNCLGKTPLQKAIAASHHSPFSVGGASWHNTNYEGPSDTVFGGIYKREVFDRIGLFDENLIRNQDDELNLRLTRSGGVIWHSPRIQSSYYTRDSLFKLYRQYYQYGYYKVLVIKKHRIPASLRHVVPFAFIISLMLGLLLLLSDALLAGFGLHPTPVLVAGHFFFTLPLLLWCLLNLAASVHMGMKSRLGYLPYYPLIFACYHFGYGIGFVLGVLDFVILRRESRANQINR